MSVHAVDGDRSAAAPETIRPFPRSYALRLAGRELRGGFGGFRIFVACLVLGVGTIAAIGSLTAAVQGGIRADARTLLGGDASARLPLRHASPAERQFLAASGTVSETARLRAMARSTDGSRYSLIELQAVDDAYPLYGTLTLSPPQPLPSALAPQDGVFGAAVDRRMADRLGLEVGDRFRIGEAVLRLGAVIESQPDAALAGLTFGPRVIVSHAALEKTELIRPGALVSYDYRLRLPPGANAAAWVEQARTAFPEAGWQLRTSRDASPSLQRLIDRVGLYLNLVGVTALLIGGIGIGNAVAAYIERKADDIATLKCLGAPTRLVFTAFLLQVLALGGIGIVAGVTLGALAPIGIAELLRPLLPVPLRLGLYPSPLGVAALCGLLTTLLFSLVPLAAIGRIAPAALFRQRIAPVPRRLPPLAIGASLAAALGLAAVVVLMAPDRRVALWYLGGAVGATVLLRFLGGVAVWIARRLPRPRRPAWRLAFANLHRPGAPTGRILLSLGLGLGLMVAVVLVQGNLAIEVGSRLAERAPADFFIDIQPDQLAGFAEIVNASPGARFEQVPMLRGRITRLNGTPVETATVATQAQWALRGDRGLTYASTLPAGSTVVAGEWWPPDYSGPPLVSFDAELARGMGLAVGDTLSVNVLGREVTARIANLRRIEWTRLGINFVLVFAPGTLEKAPQTHLAALYADPPLEEQLVRRITQRFSNVSAIPVREPLAAVTRIIAAIGAAMRIVALVGIGAGVLVLGGAVAAGHRRRVYDAVVLKVLGAHRRTIAAAFLIEQGLIGCIAALAGAGLGTLAAYALVTGPMNSAWVFLPAPVLATAAGAVAVTLALGLAAAWRALGVSAAPYLRNE